MRNSASITDNLTMDTELPPAYLEQMKRLLGSDYPVFYNCYVKPPVQGMRLNTIKLPDQTSRLAFLDRISEQHKNFDCESVPWCQAGFTLPEDVSLGKHPYHAAGLYYLQDPSAMAAHSSVYIG